MAVIKASEQIDKGKTLDDKIRNIQVFLQDVKDVINGRLSFDKNFIYNITSVTFTNINSTTSVSHNLNRIPTGYIVVSKSKSMIIYNDSPATDTTLFLKSTATGTIKIFII